MVVCFCARWCGTCRDYQAAFASLAPRFQAVDWIWIDIEDDAAWIGDIEVEDFPTILIQRGEWVLFFGPMPPQLGLLQRTLEFFQQQTSEQSRDYALAAGERCDWQERYDFRPALRRRPNPEA